MLIVDEVSMFGRRTLDAVNEQLCRLRESTQDFGGVPIVLCYGDFHQFRPVVVLRQLYVVTVADVSVR